MRLTPPWQGMVDRRRQEQARRKAEEERRKRRDLKILGAAGAVLAIIVAIGVITEDDKDGSPGDKQAVADVARTSPPAPAKTQRRQATTPPRATAATTTPAAARPVRYADCAAVKAAGAAPLRKADQGYRAAWDLDRDGKACEANGDDATKPATKKPPTRATTVPPAEDEDEDEAEPESGLDPRFPTCKAANAAGYGPYSRGDVEYGWYRDRDKDGQVCE